MKFKIAYVDDDVKNLLFYKEMLSEDFEVEVFSRSIDLLDALETNTFDCFILDIYMPIMDGFKLKEAIRNRSDYSQAPIFMITSNPNDKIKVMSYKNGATDFFDRMEKKEEFIVRLQSKIKTFRENMSLLKMNNLSLDLHQIDCYLNGEKIVLTLIEFKILSKLIRSHPSKISKDEIVKFIWGNEIISANNLNSHLYNLRMKVEDWDYSIENHRQLGFYLKPKKDPEA